jgi:hypothetical protein
MNSVRRYTVGLILELARQNQGQCWMRAGICLFGLWLASAAHAQTAALPAAPSASRTVASPHKPLDLRVGPVRRYLPPGEAAKLQAGRTPTADVETVMVEGDREKIPDRLKEQVPSGLLGGLFFTVTNPTKAWRILVPDPNAAPAAPPRSDVPPQPPRIGCGPGTNKIFCD